jgi:K+-sensing histidine kinase KdpD
MSYPLPRDSEYFRLDWQFRISAALHQEPPCVPNILYAALKGSCEATDAQQGCVLLMESPLRLFLHQVGGAPSETPISESDAFWQFQKTQGLVAYVEHEQRVLVVRNTRVDMRWRQPPPVLLSRGSIVGVPLMADKRLYGVMLLLHPQVDHFGEDSTRLLQGISDVIGASVRNALHVERLQAGAQPKAVEDLRQDLRAMTYHDMRGLLQNVQLGLAALERMVTSDSRAVELARGAGYNTRQMTRMVKNLLDIERLETAQVTLYQGEIPLSEMADNALELVRPMLDENDHGLVLEIPHELPHVMADSDMIIRVIVNLIENAAKYTPKGSSIWLSADAKDEFVTVRVRDTGPGIPNHLKDDIFDKYFRVRHKGSPSGIGLGLAFCRLAVEAHGGRIWVENDAKGGAIFSFTLPAILPIPISHAVGAD